MRRTSYGAGTVATQLAGAITRIRSENTDGGATARGDKRKILFPARSLLFSALLPLNTLGVLSAYSLAHGREWWSGSEPLSRTTGLNDGLRSVLGCQVGTASGRLVQTLGILVLGASPSAGNPRWMLMANGARVQAEQNLTLTARRGCRLADGFEEHESGRDQGRISGCTGSKDLWRRSGIGRLGLA